MSASENDAQTVVDGYVPEPSSFSRGQDEKEPSTEMTPYEFLALEASPSSHGVHTAGNQPESYTRICSICLEYLADDTKVWVCRDNERMYCCPCLVDWLTHHILEDRSHCPIACPDNCAYSFIMDDVLLMWTQQAVRVATETITVSRYFEQIISKCPQCDTPRTENGRMCSNCLYNFVTNTPFVRAPHEREHGKWTARARSELWRATHTRTCPKCRSAIEKNKGCRHMVCTQCGYEFCWDCKTAWGGHQCPLDALEQVALRLALLLTSPLWGPPLLAYVAVDRLKQRMRRRRAAGSISM